MKRKLKFIPILVIAFLFLGLAVILPTQVEAAFESQVTTAGVAVVSDSMIDIGSDPPITGSDQNLLADDIASIAGHDLTRINFGNGAGIGPGGGILPLPLIDGASVITTSYDNDAALTPATELDTAQKMRTVVGLGILVETPAVLKIDENTSDSTMTVATYAPTTASMKDETGAFPITMGSVAWALTMTIGFGLLLAARWRRATFARTVVPARSLAVRCSRGHAASN